MCKVFWVYDIWFYSIKKKIIQHGHESKQDKMYFVDKKIT